MDILYDRIINGNRHLIRAAGLSTETPPTKMVRNVLDALEGRRTDGLVIEDEDE